MHITAERNMETLPCRAERGYGGNVAKWEHSRMSKVSRDELEQELLDAFRRCGLKEQGEEFIKDLFTESEIVMFARRIQIARRLLMGETFRKISADLCVGLDTITRVHTWLERKFEDYRTVVPPLVEKQMKRQETEKRWKRTYSFGAVRRRYPFHFLLFNVLCAAMEKERERERKRRRIGEVQERQKQVKVLDYTIKELANKRYHRDGTVR